MRLRQSRCEPLQVTARPGEDADRLIRRFRRLVREEGVLREVFERRHFVKPSQRKRRRRRTDVQGS